MDFIYTNKQSISKEICEDLIYYFNKNISKGYKGCTFAGVHEHIKDSWDLCIDNYTNDDKWNKYYKLLSSEIEINLKNYIKKINNDNNIDNILTNSTLKPECFQMQKYEKNKGKYIYHSDGSNDYKGRRYRVITYLWYLNNVDDGGETEFFSNYKVKPEAGKLILFPASWTYPHCGKMPISNDKYIITGWVYLYED